MVDLPVLVELASGGLDDGDPLERNENKIMKFK